MHASSFVVIHQRILYYPESLLLPRRGSPKIMKYIESHFLEITFIVVFFSVINMVSSDTNVNNQTESKIASQILCR